MCVCVCERERERESQKERDSRCRARARTRTRSSPALELRVCQTGVGRAAHLQQALPLSYTRTHTNCLSLSRTHTHTRTRTQRRHTLEPRHHLLSGSGFRGCNEVEWCAPCPSIRQSRPDSGPTFPSSRILQPASSVSTNSDHVLTCSRLWGLGNRKVDIRLDGKGDSTPMAQGWSTTIIEAIRWIRTSRSSIKNPLSLQPVSSAGTNSDHVITCFAVQGLGFRVWGLGFGV